MFSKDKYLKDYRKKSKREGVCLDCSKPAVEGKLRCEEHLQYQRDEAKRRRYAKKLC